MPACIAYAVFDFVDNLQLAGNSRVTAVPRGKDQKPTLCDEKLLDQLFWNFVLNLLVQCWKLGPV